MITVFTPTFNRAHTVDRVWSSLLSQTYRDFEWVVIDDGSKDNIEEVMESYIAQNIFSITFFKFEKNKGKHVATNKALSLAKGEFFVVADSDDAFTSDALSFFKEGWDSIPLGRRSLFCGIRACSEDQFGNRVSDVLPQEPMDLSMSDAFYIHNFKRESWCMVCTDIHRKYLFDESHKGYYPEGIIWKAMSRDYLLRFYNKPTRRYYINESSNSIMKSSNDPYKKISRNLVGSLDILNNDAIYFNENVAYFLKIGLLYVVYSFFDNSLMRRVNKITTTKIRLFILAIIPVGVLIYIGMKCKYLWTKKNPVE